MKAPYMIAHTEDAVIYTIGGHPDHPSRVTVKGLGVVLLQADIMPGGHIDLTMMPARGSFAIECEWIEIS